jgi:hypothetical protein
MAGCLHSAISCDEFDVKMWRSAWDAPFEAQGKLKTTPLQLSRKTFLLLGSILGRGGILLGNG